MLNIILTDLWDSLDLLITCVIITATVIVNIFVAFRVMYMVKNYRDPIQAFQKETSELESVLKNQKDYDKINGI
jgi:hypothetical protein